MGGRKGARFTVVTQMSLWSVAEHRGQLARVTRVFCGVLWETRLFFFFFETVGKYWNDAPFHCF